MSKKGTKSLSPSPATIEIAVVNPHAAGIDIGSKFHVAAVGQRNEDLIEFGITTPELHELAQAFERRGIRTVALESTGYFWIPVAMLLRDYGFEVIVVNGASVKGFNRPKTDPKDARWIQKLHTLGLLKASFQLDNFNEGLRTYTRRRRTLVQDRTRLLNRMHKALVLMNVQIGMFLTELDSKSGMDIITAIVGGERNPIQLYTHVRSGVKTPKEQMIKALTGTWQPQHLFELKQLHAAYLFCMQQINECDVAIDSQLEAYCKEKGITPTPPDSKPPSNKRSAFYDNHAPKFKVVENLQRIVKADFLAIDGIGPNFILDVVSELGFTLEQFPSAKHFTSWLALSPQNKISGGKVLSSKVPKRNNRAAQAFRQAANSIGNTLKHPLRPFFLNIQRKQGRKGAIVATARKLATIVFHMVTENTPFDYQISEEQKIKQRNNLIKKLQRLINEQQFSIEELKFAA
jgi:transposase